MLADEYFVGVAAEKAFGFIEQAENTPQLAALNLDGGAKRLRVLVLEDDRLQLELLIEHLQSVGLTSTGVDTIVEARNQLTNNKFDLAILDVQLPDGSGLELCNSISDDVRFCSMPTIVLSNMNLPNMVRRSRSAGASFFIGKPYDPNVLLTVIESALGIDLQ